MYYGFQDHTGKQELQIVLDEDRTTLQIIALEDPLGDPHSSIMVQIDASEISKFRDALYELQQEYEKAVKDE